MKKTILILSILFISVLSYGQAWSTGMIKPSGTTPLQGLDIFTFDILKSDTIIHMKVGRYGDFPIYSAKQVQHKIDSLANTPPYEYEVIAAGVTSYTLPFPLKAGSFVWYNGNLLPQKSLPEIAHILQ